jgi:hypothetical protein
MKVCKVLAITGNLYSSVYRIRVPLLQFSICFNIKLTRFKLLGNAQRWSNVFPIGAWHFGDNECTTKSTVFVLCWIVFFVQAIVIISDEPTVSIFCREYCQQVPPETVLPVYETTRRHIPDNRSLNILYKLGAPRALDQVSFVYTIFLQTSSETSETE